MRMRKTMSLFAVLLLVGFSQVINGQRPWIHLGDKHVDGKSDHDKISIGTSEGRFHQLQIRVEDADVDFQRVVVHFGNGEDEQLPVSRKNQCRRPDAPQWICADIIGTSRASSFGIRKWIGVRTVPRFACLGVEMEDVLRARRGHA
jgi:hypothetical protein